MPPDSQKSKLEGKYQPTQNSSSFQEASGIIPSPWTANEAMIRSCAQFQTVPGNINIRVLS